LPSILQREETRGVGNQNVSRGGDFEVLYNHKTAVRMTMSGAHHDCAQMLQCNCDWMIEVLSGVEK